MSNEAPFRIDVDTLQARLAAELLKKDQSGMADPESGVVAIGGAPDAPAVDFTVWLDCHVSRRQFWHVVRDPKGQLLWSGPRFADCLNFLLDRDARKVAFVTALSVVVLQVSWRRDTVD